MNAEPKPDFPDDNDPLDSIDSTQQSIMDELVDARKEAMEDQTVDIAIPGYKDKLVARYGLMDTHEITKVSKRARRQYRRLDEQGLAAACDLLIAACEGLFYRNQEDTLIPIMNGGVQVRYDEAAAEFLKIEASGARAVVLGVFANNEIALMNHQNKLVRWMSGSGANIDEEFLGE